MQLRWYQDECRNKLFEYFNHNNGNPLLCLPTGAGKSVIIADIIKTTLMQWNTTRIMMLTHVKELVQQNADKLYNLWANAPLGIYSAGLRKRDKNTNVVFGNMQSVVNEIKRCNAVNEPHFGHIDLLIIDECHLVSEKEETSYRTIIYELYKINPYIKVIGLTATPFRLKSGMLTEGGIFTDIAYNLCDVDNFNRLLKDGYLSPLITKKTVTRINTDNVSVQAGEYNLKQLEQVADVDEITYNALSELVEYGVNDNRKSWLIFGTSVKHCEHINQVLLSFGIESAVTHSKLSSKENDYNIEAFKAGDLRCLINNNKLTTGFDHPSIDLIGMLRPTMSPNLHIQMLGRGLRIAEGKENCLVLDFAKNTERLGAINDPVLPNPHKKKGTGGGEAYIKVCPHCRCYNHARATVCSVCGQEFKLNSKLFETSSDVDIIKDNTPVFERFRVTQVFYYERVSKGKGEGRKMLEVVYQCGLQEFKEYVLFEHNGYARKRAEEWWRMRSTEPVPLYTYEALGLIKKLKVPFMLTVHVNKTYPEIKSVEF